MGTEIANINVRIEDDQAITDSRNVAEVFGKEHRNVLRAIDDLKGGLLNFEQTFKEATMPDSQGKAQRVYLMNRDGFTLLAMGFTGKAAMEWKVKYLEAFNKMEAALQSDDYIVARAQQILSKRLEDQQRQIEEMKPKADYFDALVDHKLNLSFTDTAKEIGVRRSNFIEWLKNNKYIFKDQKGEWKPYQRRLEQGLFEVKEYTGRYNEHSGTQTVVTPKGRQVFRMLLNPLEDESKSLED